MRQNGHKALGYSPLQTHPGWIHTLGFTSTLREAQPPGGPWELNSLSPVSLAEALLFHRPGAFAQAGFCFIAHITLCRDSPVGHRYRTANEKGQGCKTLMEYRDWFSNTESEPEARDARPRPKLRERMAFYIHAQSTSTARYILEQTIFAFCSWIPGLLGVGIRALLYKLIVRCDGWAAIEPGVRICQARNVTLRDGAYLDHGVYLHACPEGIEIGENTYVMHHAELHVYNFRGLEQSEIRIGRNCIIGEYSVVRGQGGVRIGDHVIIGPQVQILAVNHIFTDPNRLILEQGLRARGIEIEDNVWVGAGAIILDGVQIGRGAVIGAGAVVTRNVEPNTVVAGVPARWLHDTFPQRKPLRRRTTELA